MKRSMRLNMFAPGVLSCLVMLVGLSGVSTGDTDDIRRLPKMSPRLGAKLSAAESIEMARVRAFRPLPGTLGLRHRRDQVQDKATAGMKRGDATAGALLELKLIPAVNPIVKPKLPPSDGLKKPTLLKFKQSSCTR